MKVGVWVFIALLPGAPAYAQSAGTIVGRDAILYFLAKNHLYSAEIGRNVIDAQELPKDPPVATPASPDPPLESLEEHSELNPLWQRQISRVGAEIDRVIQAFPEASSAARDPFPADLKVRGVLNADADSDLTFTISTLQDDAILAHEVSHRAWHALEEVSSARVLDEVLIRGLTRCLDSPAFLLGFSFDESAADTYAFSQGHLATLMRPPRIGIRLEPAAVGLYPSMLAYAEPWKSAYPLAFDVLIADANYARETYMKAGRDPEFPDAHAISSVIHSLLLDWANRSREAPAKVYGAWFDRIKKSMFDPSSYLGLVGKRKTDKFVPAGWLSLGRVLDAFALDLPAGSREAFAKLRSEYRMEDPDTDNLEERVNLEWQGLDPGAPEAPRLVRFVPGCGLGYDAAGAKR